MHNKHKGAIFKIINRFKIEVIKQVGEDSRGQITAFVSDDDAKIIDSYIMDRKSQGNVGDEMDDIDLDNIGNFYLLQLEPIHDPNRFKVGFAMDVNERLIKHKCAAPYSKVVKSWRCKLLWEKTAIDCVTIGCEKLHTEVFRSINGIDAILIRCDQFFSLFVNYQKSAQQGDAPELASPAR